MINVNYHTNLDLKSFERWPDMIKCRPVKGDLITSSTGLELEVCRVTFPYNTGVCARCIDINVELMIPTNRFENITAFEKWYNKR